MKTFKFYKTAFGTAVMYPTPPNREYIRIPIIGRVQTKTSKRMEAEYLYRVQEWKDARNLPPQHTNCRCARIVEMPNENQS
jgi:hypothetical protein